MAQAREIRATVSRDAGGNRGARSGQRPTTHICSDAGKLVKITYPDMQREEFLYDGDGMRAKHRPKSTLLSPKQWVKFTYWDSIIDTNLNPDEEIFFYSGNELVEIFHDTDGGTDLRFNTFNDYLSEIPARREGACDRSWTATRIPVTTAGSTTRRMG
jgi:YD repeat-containing protein